MANEIKKFLDLTGLGEFKTKQDQFNAATYIPLSQKAAANGVATLDNNGLVPAAQLPSYVDDVRGFANTAAFPAEGESGKIYVAFDDGKIYRWADNPSFDPGEEEGEENPKGSYIQISSSVSTADEALKLTPGANINGVLFDGTQAITLPTADAAGAGAEAGTVIVGAGIDLAQDGTISVATATDSLKGLVQVGDNIDVANGVISVATATGSVKGVVQVGTNIDVANGVISVATATDAALGVAQAGTNIDVASGVFSVKTGSTTDKGVLSVGDNITVANGEISLTDTNIADALGYTIQALTTSEVDTLFSA